MSPALERRFNMAIMLPQFMPTADNNTEQNFELLTQMFYQLIDQLEAMQYQITTMEEQLAAIQQASSSSTESGS
jgi:hypothetical protein